MITHQQKKMGLDALRQFRDRFAIPVKDEEFEKLPFIRFEEGSEELRYLRARREALGGYLPSRRRNPTCSSRCRRCRPSRRSSRRRTAARSPRRWRSCASSTRSCATRASASTSCRSCPTRAARSAWRACSASSASGARSASSTARRMPTSSCSTRRIARPGAAGGHQRAGRHVELDRRDELLDLQLPDDPVLHLLLDVRLPARRRPRLGGGRHARARLSRRRHVGAHDAQRRGPAARGRPQPSCRRRSRTASPTTRPMPTNSPSSSTTSCAREVGEQEDVFYYLRPQRELRAPGDAERA